MKRATVSIIYLLLSFLSCTAQNQTFIGLLPAISLTGRINKKIDYNIFTSTTIDLFNKKIQGIEYPARDLQLYFQPSIIYKVSPSLNISASYTFQKGYSLSGLSYNNEHRIWEQIIYGYNIAKYRITNRIRFEQRLIQNRNNGKYPFGTRLRYQLGLNFPLQGKTLEKHEFYLNAYNEFYISLTGQKNATYSGNWSYLGIGYFLGKTGKIEIGYLLQTGPRNTKQDLLTLHLCQITWLYNIGRTNKKF